MRLYFCLMWLTVAGACGGSVAAQEREPTAVAAVANGYPITMGRVDRYLQKAIGRIQIPDAMRNRARSEALEQLIRRHAVLAGLRKSGSQVGDAEIRLEVSKLEDRLKEVDQILPDYLASAGMTREELAYEFEWRIAWSRYLTRHLTDERLEQYYQRHRRRFDGSQMKVAHLLLRPSKENDGLVLADQAAAIRADVTAGKISWAQAVAEHSEATATASRQGVAGWISYNGPMPETFCHAAFELEPDQISNPVTTAFGVHLIKCLEIRAGTIGPRDARDAVRDDAMRYLFDRMADRERNQMTVEYQVEWPQADGGQ